MGVPPAPVRPGNAQRTTASLFQRRSQNNKVAVERTTGVLVRHVNEGLLAPTLFGFHRSLVGKSDGSNFLADFYEIRDASLDFQMMEDSLYFVFSGSGLLRVLGQEHLLRSSMVVIIPRNTAHVFLPPSSLEPGAVLRIARFCWTPKKTND